MLIIAQCIDGLEMLIVTSDPNSIVITRMKSNIGGDCRSIGLVIKPAPGA